MHHEGVRRVHEASAAVSGVDRIAQSSLENKLRMSVALLGGDATTKEVQRMDTQLAVRNETATLSTRQLFAINSFDEAMRIATILSKTEFVPQAYRGKPEAALAAIMMGAELSLGPLQALQGIAVINGRPSVWGDTALALCQRHHDFVDCIETYDAAKRLATCTIKRKGREPVTRTFNWDDAVRAKLAGKDTYQSYPQRMLPMRARAWAMRDTFSDALRGLSIVEEVRDYVQLDDGAHATITAATWKPAEAITATVVPAEPPPVAAVAEPVAGDPRDFQIREGKNKGKKLSQLGFKQLEWYSTECKDLQTRAAAKVVFTAKWPSGVEQPSAAAFAEYIDPDGVVHNSNAGEAAQ